MLSRCATSLVLVLFACSALAAGPSGEKFLEPRQSNAIRALLVGGGSSHDFEKFFHATDSATLKPAGVDPVYTEDKAEAIALLAQADVLVLSANKPEFGAADFQQALNAFSDGGKGVVVLHPGAWYNWPAETNFNAKFVGGGARSHDRFGKFSVTVKEPTHPIMAGVPPSFEVSDELYQTIQEPADAMQVLAVTSVSGVTKKEHASVWTVTHPKARVAGIALGHDGATHDLSAFKAILINAVRWAAQK